jgi:hypothetical protein
LSGVHRVPYQSKCILEEEKGKTTFMYPLSTSPSTMANLQILEEVLYDLPPLEGVFLHWHTYGVTATTAGIVSLFTRRKQLLGPTTLSGASIRLLYECANDSLRRLNLPVQDLQSPWDSRPLHARLLRHGPTLSAAETQALLPPGVLVQKTVTLTLADTLLLFTGAGSQRVNRQQLRAISEALALPRRAVKQCTVNDTASNLVELFAMQPGMVSPFIHPNHERAFDVLVLLPWPERWEARQHEVAISLSLWESLVLPLGCLRSLLRSYARRAYPEVRFIELESGEALYAHA